MGLAAVRNARGQTALHLVGSADRAAILPRKDLEVKVEEIIQLLISAGCPLEQKALNGQTALCMVVSRFAKESSSIPVALRLLAAGADPENPDIGGKTPLHYAVKYWQPDILERMLKQGLDLELKDKLGCTPLHATCRHGYSDTVRILLTAKANVNAQDGQGATALHHAMLNTSNGDEVISLLSKNGAFVHARDNQDMTALHWAADQGREELIHIFLRRGASPEALDANGYSPMYLAARRGYLALWRELYKATTTRSQGPVDLDRLRLRRHQTRIFLLEDHEEAVGQHSKRRATI